MIPNKPSNLPFVWVLKCQSLRQVKVLRNWLYTHGYQLSQLQTRVSSQRRVVGYTLWTNAPRQITENLNLAMSLGIGDDGELERFFAQVSRVNKPKI